MYGHYRSLLRTVYEETQHQGCIEACGYRSPTWQILRALKSINASKVVLRESAVTAASFFERSERPSKPFWEPQQGNKMVLWESLSGGVLEKDGLYGARPIRAKEQRGTGVPRT